MTQDKRSFLIECREKLRLEVMIANQKIDKKMSIEKFLLLNGHYSTFKIGYMVCHIITGDAQFTSLWRHKDAATFA